MTASRRRAGELLPKSWPRRARSAVLQAISLASTVFTIVSGQAIGSRRASVRLTVEVETLRNEVALLREELRLKDARMERLLPSRRPHYSPLDGMAILELRSRRGWSSSETAERFLIEPKTVAAWMRRRDEPGERPLVQTAVPINKYPEFVGYIVRRLRTLCPTMGRRRIAQVLARAGLHLGSTTVRRMSHHIGPDDGDEVAALGRRHIVAKAANQVWSLDLTVVPTQGGFWTLLSPFAWLQRWPFCCWVAVVADPHSRRAVGFGVFRRVPKARDVIALLQRAIEVLGTAPRSVLTDQGKQFRCSEFRRWCRGRGIRPRYGAVGRPGSIALVERFIRSLKDECTRRLVMPMRPTRLRQELALYSYWYNHHRPHQSLEGRTPDEVSFSRRPANERPRHEPRATWPRSGKCAVPSTEVRGRCGAVLNLSVAFLEGRRHLPVVQLRRAA